MWVVQLGSIPSIGIRDEVAKKVSYAVFELEL